MSQKHVIISHVHVYSDNCTCCHTEIEVAAQTFYLCQSQYTDTGPTSPSTDPVMPGACRVATGVPILKSLVRLDPEKIATQMRESNPESAALEADVLTTKPTMLSLRVALMVVSVCAR